MEITRPTLGEDVRTAEGIVAQVRAAGIDEDDPDFADLVEAECDAPERCRRTLRVSGEAMDDAAKLAGMIVRLQIRKKRATAAWAMGEMGLTKLQAPDFTATLSAGRPKVTITDEAAIPADLSRVKREPNKTAILAALTAGREVPGAELANPQPVLTLRTT